ncbi:hypothetical protein D9758_006752 [Tetrapyrgos nigripes]|uniref:CCR4-Not complex 3'-5'-exoribonuclease subunit Ccr4 n=1 Tax=Tetrapyrgos nigripes TaxID=182062 RepID=A0A8H5FU29_9AGAR|nr:hypothetical protein D9758_006752 [Tetrapyrgos nigripes]
MNFYPSSPGISKLPNDWQRNHFPPPTSPGYPIHPHQLHPNLHQHYQTHYPSPPSLQPHVLAQGSPVSIPAQPMTQHWQQQLLKCEIIRGSRSPHHRAKSNALAARAITKSAIPITNPNALKSPERDPTSSPSPESSSNHPSSTVAPVTKAPRPTSAAPPSHVWTSLDMGGINIKNLPSSSGLFSFDFLVTLYLNHNTLASVPPEISKLRHLELLDLSGNVLETLPPELGMLTNLKELYLFDNRITSLPSELGTLHQLQTLGIEGNPLDAHTKSLVQKEGTHALIAHLRDTCPPLADPPARPWHQFADPDLSAETISVLCYNILCERYATERLYGYTPQWALSWEYRKELILSDLQGYGADFLCLQEVDVAQYEDYFTKNLAESGYTGVYWPKGRAKNLNETDRRQVDGCATFYKSDKFTLIESHVMEFATVAMQRSDFKKTEDMFNRVLGKDQIATICLFENKLTGTRLIVGNCHIHWDPAYSDVKLVQVALMIEEIEKVADSFAKFPPRRLDDDSMVDEDEEHEYEQPSSRKRLKSPIYTDGTKIPLIIAGDFNSQPESSVCDFLTNGTLRHDHEDFKGHLYGKYTSEGLRHRLGLKSAYSMVGVQGINPPPPMSTSVMRVNGSGNGAQVNGMNGHSTSTTNGNGTSGTKFSSSPSTSSSSTNGFTSGNELLKMTNYTPSFRGVLDYIWYSTANLGVNTVLGNIDQKYLDKVVGFPNAHYPSDHICIMSEFRIKPPREAPARPPPPTFNSHSSSS